MLRFLSLGLKNSLHAWGGGGRLVSNLPRPPQVIISMNRIQVPLGCPFWTILDEYKMTKGGIKRKKCTKLHFCRTKGDMQKVKRGWINRLIHPLLTFVIYFPFAKMQILNFFRLIHPLMTFCIIS